MSDGVERNGKQRRSFWQKLRKGQDKIVAEQNAGSLDPDIVALTALRHQKQGDTSLVGRTGAFAREVSGKGEREGEACWPLAHG